MSEAFVKIDLHGLRQEEAIKVIVVCPEQLGGLPTPRVPSPWRNSMKRYCHILKRRGWMTGCAIRQSRKA